MKTMVITIPVQQITDWESFHDVFKVTFGFPDFYGRNLDAWIDCMTWIDEAEHGLSTLTVQGGMLLVLRIDDTFGFMERCPEQWHALVECVAFVNYRREELGLTPVLGLLPSVMK